MRFFPCGLVSGAQCCQMLCQCTSRYRHRSGLLYLAFVRSTYSMAPQTRSRSVASQVRTAAEKKAPPAKTQTRAKKSKILSDAKRRQVKTLEVPSAVDVSVEQGLADHVQRNLLGWYDRNFRALPWRTPPGEKAASNASNAYAIWVSEIMLQQTQVGTVVDYFARWMQRFPTVIALAGASLDEVNGVWAGLGYYRRSKMLHEGAQYVTDVHQGQIPTTYEQLLKIPGIGPYTAAAIASIAFNQCNAAVDGNVIRVISRLLCVGHVAANSTQGAKLFQQLATEMMKGLESRPGDYNQALMDLGATICTPRAPKCSACPLQAQCRAYKEAQSAPEVDVSLILKYPNKTRKAKAREETLLCCIVVGKDGHFLVTQRPDKGLLAGLWEFPAVVDHNTTTEDINSRLLDLLNRIGCGLDPKAFDLQDTPGVPTIRALGNFVHVFSHIRQTVMVWAVEVPEKALGSSLGVSGETPRRWVHESKLADLAMSTQMRKVFQLFKSTNT
ncbi:Adenine DNA glycosylase [Porphyridium purpureum]|uniref:Adenine DNA glycosylase n=1 Tax=Porphyridium purpureum TaxID=35688 RepID=A0A5J4Z530_PORPP|nr:Adenine DNA glycosylase [Porphyridium purpureum]|eukprot:POR8396..scf295_1